MSPSEADAAVANRPPAEDTFDGFTSARFYRAGRGSHGRPHVPVFKGDRQRVSVGCFVSIEPDVDFHVGGNHRIDWVTTYGLREMFDLPGAFVGNPWSRGDITVRDAATIGRGAKIMSGVTIGEGALVAPSSVVTRDVQPYAVATGSPARERGLRFPGAVVPELLRIDWANWPPERIDAEVRRLAGVAADELAPALASTSTSGSDNGGQVNIRRTRTLGRPRAALSRAFAVVARSLDPEAASLPKAPEQPTDGGRVTLGRATYFSPIVHAGTNPAGRVAIGNYTSIARDTEILLEGYPAQAAEAHRPASTRGAIEAATATDGDVRIGSDVWTASGAKIFAGVTIGDGAVVAAWSVVTTDVAPYSIVAGNPAREIGRRFDESTIEALLRIRWWDWDDDVILSRWRELCSPDVASFVARYDRASPPTPPGEATSRGRPDLGH